MIKFEKTLNLKRSILSEVSFLRADLETNKVIKNIEIHLNSMLTSSESNSSNFVACILEIGLKHAKSLRLDVSSVSTACLNSLQQPLGIILLEEYLILNEFNEKDDSSGPPSTKRLKFSNDCEDVSQVKKNECYNFFRIFNLNLLYYIFKGNCTLDRIGQIVSIDE